MKNQLSQKAIELRAKFYNNYAATAGVEAADEAFQNPAILSGLNAFMEVIAQMHRDGYAQPFDETAKAEWTPRA